MRTFILAAFATIFLAGADARAEEDRYVVKKIDTDFFEDFPL